MKICRGNPNTVKILTQISGTLHEDQRDFQSVGSDNIQRNNIDNAMFSFHDNAFRIYYIFDSDMLRQQYEGKAMLRFNGDNWYAKLYVRRQCAYLATSLIRSY